MPKPDQPKVSVVLYTILDNYHRHVEELRAVGAQPADLQPLKAAAAAVEAAELEADRLGIDVGAATAPFLSCTGWTIAPPTVAARYWAGLALIKITGGKAPDAVLGEFLALFAGLLILRLWGEGQKDQVMRLVTRPGELAELLATSTEAPKDLDLDKLADEWLVLMGLKKKAAQARYDQMLAQIRTRLPPTAQRAPAKKANSRRATTRRSPSARPSQRATST